MRSSAEGGRTRIPAWIILLLALLALGSCGGSGSSRRDSADVAAPDAAELELRLSSTTQLDGTIEVELLAANAASLYQLSTRVTFNEAAVRPLGPAVVGNLPAVDAIFYSNDRQSGYVPVAFSNRQAQALGQAAGVLFRARFEVLDAALDPKFNLLRSPEFLIARDNAAQDMDLVVEVSK